MISLPRFVHIFEGGAGGHMAHPFDYTDFTANDLIDLVDSLFKGKIEDLKEKLDGFNIEATLNKEGKAVFIRNDEERNSEQGGITIDEMYKKWEGKDQQIKVFTTSGKIIEQILSKFSPKDFNPDENHRKILNCECIVAGQTNIMPYAADRVAFHGYKIYEKAIGDKKGKFFGKEIWKVVEDVEGHVDDIYKAAEGIDQAKPRPNLVVKSVEDGIKFSDKFTKAITKLWEDEGLKNDASIEDWKKIRFKKFAQDWFKDDDDIFNRMCNDDKSVNANELKKRYPDHKDDIKLLDKELRREIVGKIMEPMDNLFLAIGNELIDILDGFINSGAKDKVTQQIKTDLENVTSEVEKSDSIKAKDKVEKALQRLQALGNKYNAAEGIVIMYKGRRLKMTGSFAPVNQVLGARFDLENK